MSRRIHKFYLNGQWVLRNVYNFCSENINQTHNLQIAVKKDEKQVSTLDNWTIKSAFVLPNQLLHYYGC